jgi:hypothetical protein
MHTYVEYCSTSTTQKFVGQTDYLICDSATNEPADQPFFFRNKAAIFNQKLVSYNGLGCPPTAASASTILRISSGTFALMTTHSCNLNAL